MLSFAELENVIGETDLEQWKEKQGSLEQAELDAPVGFLRWQALGNQFQPEERGLSSKL